MKKHPVDYESNPYEIHYNNYLNTNSCTECTGLMYRAAEDHEEWEAYREIFDFTPVPDSLSPRPDEE